MISRSKLLAQAVEDCLQELYSVAQPSVTWENFKAECVEYNEKISKLPFFSKEENPKPFEFYYLPKQIIKEIVNSYIHAYKLNEQQELLNTIEILKKYCQEPIIKKYIDGCKEYKYSDNLQLSLYKKSIDMFPNGDWGQFEEISKMAQNKFFEFLDMAGKFYNWTSELNSFITSIYLGACPCSSKQTVIDNWKKYRNQDIEIDEEQIKKEYYGED
jgi:hypothetical protein